MKNTFGNNITVTVFGESHGPAIGCVLDGLAPGMKIDEKYIALALSKRRPQSAADTPRKEPDEFQIISGAFNGKTTGTPLCIVIPNVNTKSRDYVYGPARPAHADYAAFCKYHGYEDYRGGGHFSGRITAALVAAGAVLMPSLESLGIKIGTHILSCADVSDREFKNISSDIDLLSGRAFPVLDEEKAKEISDVILKAKQENDSVGGITESAVCGVPAGVGEPWFDSMESMISHAVFSLGGVKGIEFGAGFKITKMKGSEANDPLYMSNGSVASKSNNNGGINGGITNGMPVIFRCAVKPTASISRQQDTINFLKMKDEKLEIKGRHDPAIIRRICPVIDAVTAIVTADALSGRFGTDYLAGKRPDVKLC